MTLILLLLGLTLLVAIWSDLLDYLFLRAMSRDIPPQLVGEREVLAVLKGKRV